MPARKIPVTITLLCKPDYCTRIPENWLSSATQHPHLFSQTSATYYCRVFPGWFPNTCGFCEITIRVFIDSWWTMNLVNSVHARVCVTLVHSSQPRSQASPVFCSSVCVQYNTRKRKSVKNREGLVSFITCVTSGGREVDVGGEGHNRVICCACDMCMLVAIRYCRYWLTQQWYQHPQAVSKYFNTCTHCTAHAYSLCFHTLKRNRWWHLVVTVEVTLVRLDPPLRSPPLDQ